MRRASSLRASEVQSQEGDPSVSSRARALSSSLSRCGQTRWSADESRRPICQEAIGVYTLHTTSITALAAVAGPFIFCKNPPSLLASATLALVSSSCAAARATSEPRLRLGRKRRDRKSRCLSLSSRLSKPLFPSLSRGCFPTFGFLTRRLRQRGDVGRKLR